jgi:hypothetical protein
MNWLCRLIVSLAAAFVLCVPGLVVAQVASSGTLEVIVEGSDGARLPGATVSATAADAVTRRRAVTDQHGVAALEALAPSSQYVISVELQGFATQVREAVLVRSGQTASVRFALTVAGVAESISVAAEAPIVDVRSAITGQDITLQLTEALPTGRSYQSYLQLVPGVLPDSQTSGGNPAARSGMNYSDNGGLIGVSTDNVYYFDGINVTDPVTGTFGANLNTEIIQEMRVTTGGTPAELVGSAGLIANVITKSGSDRFQGSANYFFQNSKLVSENDNGAAQEFSTDDTAFTAGGPVRRNSAWFFGSYRYTNRADDVTALDTNAFLRSIANSQHQSFAKGTWAPTNNDLVSFTYLADPTTITGSNQRNITNARDFAREQGGHRFGGTYSRVLGNTLVEIVAGKHNGSLTDLSAVRESRVSVLFRATDARTLSDEQAGGFGNDLIDERDNTAIRGSLQRTFGRHTIKGGFGWDQHRNLRDTRIVGGESTLVLAPLYAGQNVSADDIGNTAWSNLRFDVTATSDFQGFMNTVNARPDRARFYQAFDTNADGAITQGELGLSLRFNTLGAGGVSYSRIFETATGPQDTSSHGLTFFAQDQIALNRLTLNVGVRGERWDHFATTGDNIFTFDWAFAPRLSAVYDVRGDGRQKASFYYGRYYDPVRNDMTNFAGTLTGSVFDEQVFALGEWITYRTRGGPIVQDAFFAPTTKTPYTDDLEVGYAIDLGHNTSVDALYFNRRTRDLLEDYDLHLYADPSGYANANGVVGEATAQDSLFLGLDYFGYTENPGSNFVIGTLAGGKRNFQGVELVFRKRFSDRWQTLASYNWNDAEGNTNSDGNADFQGDFLFVDPRAPNQFGTQPGLIRHVVKGAGSYTFDFGLQLGAALRWNSGTIDSRTFLSSSRHVPLRVPAAEAFPFGGVTDRWLAPDSVGTIENPAWGQMDLRVQYIESIGRANLDLFVDLFNVLNNQRPVRTQDLVAGQGGTAFGEATQWVEPRRAFLGARIRF